MMPTWGPGEGPVADPGGGRRGPREV